MATATRSVERPRGELREVYVARTVKEPQKEFEQFLNKLGRRLGMAAAINTIASTHITFLESSGVARHFSSRGYSSDDIRQFRGDLEQYLRETVPGDYATVDVRKDKPFKWVGRPGTLALNIAEDDALSQERDQIEKFLRGHFGVLPNLRNFSPHITLGRILRPLSYRERSEPERVVLPGIAVPEIVALNGLEAYLGRFQPESHVATD